MFCYQCEQTQGGHGCTKFGVCGKSPEIAELQDRTMWSAKEISMYAHRARAFGVVDKKTDALVVEALFYCVTNVNFDPKRFEKLLSEMDAQKETIKKLYEDACRKHAATPEKLQQPDPAGIEKRRARLGDDATALEELVTYGLKGMAAYAHHAAVLGREDEKIYAFFHEGLDYLTRENPDAGELLKLSLKVGEVNLKVMELLDAGHNGYLGHPEPTKVRITPVEGKAILVSGHDMKDLLDLLKQTEGSGINIYTHGEMLPAHSYPALKKFKHLVGNYGGAWQDQQKEFAAFPGAILMTTNCIQRPAENYKARIFTNNMVGWPEVEQIKNNDFSPLIAAAKNAEGFKSTEPEKFITIGFGHDAVLGAAPKVIDLIKRGKIKHFFLVGGCDGAKTGRNYYTELAEKIPHDCVIMTLACGKYRFNKMEFGDIEGLPRLLDIGQCNDAYSAIKIAVELAKAFNCGVNDLPLSLVLSWYEQKAVCILLTLLHLGIKNMRLGPSLPAFVTPAMLKILVENYNIMPIKTADEDLKAMLS